MDRIAFDTGNFDQGVLVVDGFITDAPGPYTVNLFESSNLYDNLSRQEPIVAKEVRISDNEGNHELLTLIEPGIYKTSENGMRGSVGKAYHLQITLIDGTVFESAPEEMRDVGMVDSIYYQFESAPSFDGPTKYGFQVYMDASSKVGFETHSRWRVTGVYKFQVYPEKHLFRSICPPAAASPDPVPCSGVTFDGFRLVYDFEKPCTCCECWVNDREDKPYLSDELLVTEGSVRGRKIAYVPFEAENFSMGKYMVKVEQMSLSQEAFEFWKIIRDQKEGVTSLFQPAFGGIRTNFSSNNSDREVIGMFYASAVHTKVAFITSSDAPFPVPQPTFEFKDNCFYWNSCEKVFESASRTPPPEWE